ncbi:MAG TPA: serine/threonine-protein kinase [Polyangiaceae bacterium]|jgi:serine/threonine-protein kinase
MPEKAPTSLGAYEVVRPIGHGGMGTVYEGFHRMLARRVAIKVLSPNLALLGEGVVQERFLREGRAAAMVDHPNVVGVYDLGVEDGTPYLVMELVEGETLAKRILRARRLSVAETTELMLGVVSAVAELHEVGILHRDLKPANILLADGPAGVCPKIADFGVSRTTDGAGSLTESGVLLGTVAYMAPEQAGACRTSTERSDQYSLGVVLYECLTGGKPFRGSSPFDLVTEITRGVILPPSARNHDVPQELDEVVLRAMSREPEARFPSVRALGEALLPFAEPAIAARWASDLRVPSIIETLYGVEAPVRRRTLPPGRRSTMAIAALVVLTAGLTAAAVYREHLASARTERPSPSQTAPPAGCPL